MLSFYYGLTIKKGKKMLDSKLFLNAISQFKSEKNIPIETMIDALKEAFVRIYQKQFKNDVNLEVNINLKEGKIELFHIKKVVEVIKNEEEEITLENACKINYQHQIGDDCKQLVKFTKEFSILAVMRLKQIIRQKVREKEKDLILNKYQEKIGELIEGKIESEKDNYYIIAFDQTFGYLSKSQIPQNFVINPKQKIKAVINKIDFQAKGLPIILSISSPRYIEALLVLEIPEIADKTIVIDKIARYPGIRTKLIVKSNNEGVDPVGTIIGQDGERIKRIIAQLQNEFIDVIPYLKDQKLQIARSLSPAEVLQVKIENNKALVVVDEKQFPMAIGLKGSNAKVTSKLLDIEIDIKKSFEVDFEVPKTPIVFNNKKISKFNIDIKEFQVKDEDLEDKLFSSKDNQKPKSKKPSSDNFSYEKVADIPKIDNFEGLDFSKINDDEDDYF